MLSMQVWLTKIFLRVFTFQPSHCTSAAWFPISLNCDSSILQHLTILWVTWLGGCGGTFSGWCLTSYGNRSGCEADLIETLTGFLFLFQYSLSGEECWVYIFLIDSDVLLKMFHNTSFTVRKLKGWVGTGGAPFPSICFPSFSECIYCVPHRPETAELTIL